MKKTIRTKQILTSSFSSALHITKNAVEQAGFGILYEIDFKKKIQEKLGKDINECTQLGICSAKIGYQVLEIDSAYGCLLPCSLCVYQQGEKYYISTLAPSSQLGVEENKAIDILAQDANHMMKVLFDLL